MPRLYELYNNALRKFAGCFKDIRMPLPVPGLGCGVLGLALPKTTLKLGEYA